MFDKLINCLKNAIEINGCDTSDMIQVATIIVNGRITYVYEDTETGVSYYEIV